MEVTRNKIKLFDGVTSTEELVKSLEDKVNGWLAQNQEIEINQVSVSSSHNAERGYRTIVTILYRAEEEIETEEEKKRKEDLAEIGRVFEGASKEVIAEQKEQQTISEKR